MDKSGKLNIWNSFLDEQKDVSWNCGILMTVWNVR